MDRNGEDPDLIRSLLKDGHRWSKFRTRLRLHISKSRKLQKEFESSPAFYQEVLDSERKSQAKKAAATGQRARPMKFKDVVTTAVQRKPKAIEGLVGLIEEMEKALNTKISELETRTNRMIEMVSTARFPQRISLLPIPRLTAEQEFNLVSIYEARKSIEMSERSNEMAISMKRLSWITVRCTPNTSDGMLTGIQSSSSFR